MSILAVLELRQTPGAAEWHPMSLETLAGARRMATELGVPLHAAVLGSGAARFAEELAAAGGATIWLLEHDQLAAYTAEAYTQALRQLIEKAAPHCIVFPHTYQVRDFLPKLAAVFGRVAVSDVVAHRVENGTLTLVRQLFQGKINSDVRFTAPAPNFLSLQAGAYRADEAAAGGSAGAVERLTPEITQVRTRPGEPFRESQRAVDLSAAEIIVSVGRGIKEAENIQMVQELAAALGGELAASRPICDAGWLPMERQVGSSGQTVAPKLYLAVGISGAIQHLVGMKGSRVVVAINKDREAPIFEIADYGITADLFDILPELIAALKGRK